MRPRFHPALRVVLYVVALGVGIVALAAPLVLLTARAGEAGLVPTRVAGAPLAFGAAYVGMTLAVVGVTGAVCRWVDRRPLTSLGLERPRGWWGELWAGFWLAAAIMSAIFAVMIEARQWALVHGPAPVLEAAVPTTAVFFLGFLLVAFNEELVSRGYILQNLDLGLGRRLAVPLSALLFALAHLGNPGSGPLPLVGLLWAGVLLAWLYYWRRRLWLPIGYHLGWNFFQGPVFGFPVSGTQTPSLLQVQPLGPEPLSGGTFGPEASLLAMAVEGLGLLLAWGLARRGESAPVVASAVQAEAPPSAARPEA